MMGFSVHVVDLSFVEKGKVNEEEIELQYIIKI